MQAYLISLHDVENNILQVVFQQAGFLVRTIRNFDQPTETWFDNPPDFILMVNPNDQSKLLGQLREMRAFSVVPIILISEPMPEDLLVNVLESGADLVVIRPYSIRILFAQIRSILRRSSGLPSFSLPDLAQRDLLLNPSDRTVRVGNGEAKRLTHLEFRLLYTLMTHVGQIMPTEKLVEHVWGYTGDGNKDLVRGLVQRLRTKVEVDPHQPTYILTEVGIGYYFSRG